MSEPFAIYDCSLACVPAGPVVANLRELLDAVRTVSDAVLEHHLLRSALDEHVERSEFPNDFARWCWDALGDRVLGEQLGLVNPYRLPSLVVTRWALVDAVEDRLWGQNWAPACPAGLELHLCESRLLPYDTGQRIFDASELAAAIEHMSLRSLFFHFHEARRRTAGKSDDFSAWLEYCGADPRLLGRLRGIDCYFLNLHQLRVALRNVFREHAPSIQPPIAA